MVLCHIFRQNEEYLMIQVFLISYIYQSINLYIRVCVCVCVIKVDG